LNNIMNEVQKEIEKLEHLLERMRRFKLQEPKGSLKCHKKGTRTFFYQLFWDEQAQKCEEKNIRKANMHLINALAQKHYYANLEPIVKKNLYVLKELQKKYYPAELEQVYDDLCEARKGLVVPAFVSREEMVRSWIAEKYEKNEAHPEHLRFETEQGEMVRSKSEVIIADMLNRRRGEILYKYERPLELEEGGRIKVLHPDFTILNIRTGRVFYWEHAGRLGKEDYANDFVWRMNLYVRNGFLPGRDVFVTYETDGKPLDMAVVRAFVAELCRG